MLTFVSGNIAKIEHLRRHLTIPFEYKSIELPEVQSLDVHEVVCAKAKNAYQIIQSPVLVEDTSLSFRAMGQLPGPFIRWFLSELGTDGLCKCIPNTATRSAQCTVCFCYYDGIDLEYFEASMEGSIAERPRGTGGFGWDPVFVMSNGEKTRAELSVDEYEATSLRRVATEKFEKYMCKKVGERVSK
jgi:non-canonical purine NTP pyrophosphatase (RdgB/HAM1 family)